MDRRVTQPRAETRPDAESFRRGLWASVGLHIVLAGVLITSPWLFPAYQNTLWGSETGGGGGISIDLVQGVPLPAPANTRPDAAGNDSPGLYEPVPVPAAAPPEAVPEDAEPVPEVFEVAEAEEEVEPEEEPEPVRPPTPPPAPRTAPVAAPPTPPPPNPPRETASTPDNAVPFGEGGRPDVSGGFSNGQGQGGFEFGGDGAFGQQFGTYVRTMRTRISNNWYQSMVNTSVPPGQRVTFTFDILRNGNIDNVRLVESSGSPSLDDSAERALLRSSPLGELPAGYRGSRVNVRFWFEFVR